MFSRTLACNHAEQSLNKLFCTAAWQTPSLPPRPLVGRTVLDPECVSAIKEPLVLAPPTCLQGHARFSTGMSQPCSKCLMRACWGPPRLRVGYKCPGPDTASLADTGTRFSLAVKGCWGESLGDGNAGTPLLKPTVHGPCPEPWAARPRCSHWARGYWASLLGAAGTGSQLSLTVRTSGLQASRA